MIEHTLATIRTQMERMRALARSPELHACNERVSAWSPAEHLDHLTKVSSSIVRVLANESAPPVAKGINPVGRLILLVGWIPRGKGKTPERLSGTRASAADLEEGLAQLERAFDALPFPRLRTSRVPVVRHPRFGGLTPVQALRFIAVHTEHHLKIVRDILLTRVGV